jgi:hypothetical protein
MIRNREDLLEEVSSLLVNKASYIPRFLNEASGDFKKINEMAQECLKKYSVKLMK